MSREKIRYFVSKSSAKGVLHYWQPTKALRESGFTPRRLPDDKRQAIDQALTLNAELDAWRNGTTVTGAPAPLPKVEPRTLAHVIRTYERSRFFTDKRPRTKRGYKQNMDFLEAWGGDKRVAAITGETVEILYTSLRKRTPAKAAAVITMLRILLAHAKRMGLVADNAASHAGIVGAKPSGKIWPRAAVHAFVETADKLGWHSVATAVLINHWLGQREADILELPPSACADGRITITQSKTAARVSIPDNTAVRVRLLAELARQAARAAALRAKGATPLPATTLLICETTGAPWREDYFRHVFAQIRTALAATQAAWPLPDGTQVETAGLQFKHLRHTAVTELSVAGATLPQICAITGHALGTVNQILVRYLVLTKELADEAAAKRTAYQLKGEKA